MSQGKQVRVKGITYLVTGVNDGLADATYLGAQKWEPVTDEALQAEITKAYENQEADLNDQPEAPASPVQAKPAKKAAAPKKVAAKKK